MAHSCVDDVSKCQSVDEIIKILDSCHNINEKHTKLDLTLIFDHFYHIKLVHGKNAETFNKFYDYFMQNSKNNKCDANHCEFVNYYFRDRSNTNNNYKKTKKKSNLMVTKDILSRIHCYIIHSYDIYRLNPKETNQINKELEAKDEDENNTKNNENIYNKLLEKQSKIAAFQLHKNKQSLKYIQQEIEPENEENGFKKGAIVSLHGLNKQEWNGELAEIIGDIIKKSEHIKRWPIQLQKTKQKALIKQINLKIILKNEDTEWECERCTFLNELTASKCRMCACDRFQWKCKYCSLLNNITDMQCDACAHDKPDDENELNETKTADTEIKYINYWDKNKMESFIKRKYKNLKEEMTQNKLYKVTINEWNELCEMNKTYLKTKISKTLLSNGEKDELFGIKAHEMMDIYHSLALFLYTTYSSLCNAVRWACKCGMDSAVEMAIFGKLLYECVHCFGEGLPGRMYRGIDEKTFIFSNFYINCNYPMSATRNVANISANDMNGIMLLTLNNNDCVYFSADKISFYDHENENIFFGNESRLQIETIIEINNGKWINFKIYLHAIDFIIKMMNDMEYESYKDLKYDFFNTDNKLPQYIAKMLKYHTDHAPDPLNINFMKLTKQCASNNILLKENGFLNITNIWSFFKNCKHLQIDMSCSMEYLENNEFIASLFEDLSNLSVDQSADKTYQLTLEFNETILSNDKSQLDEYYDKFKEINWKIDYLETSIKFVYYSLVPMGMGLGMGALSRTKSFVSKNIDVKIQYLVGGYIRNVMKFINKIIPIEIIVLFYDYLQQTSRWDTTTTCDNQLMVTPDGLSVSSQAFNYPKFIYSTIFIDNWLKEDGKYYFKFKFNGTLAGSSDEIAIGIATQKYDMKQFDRGIGAENNSYSWYCTGAGKSSIYVLKTHKRFKYGLRDNEECSFEIVIENGGKSVYINLLYERDGIGAIEEEIRIEKIKPPVKIGVSFISRRCPLSLEIIEQKRPWYC